jgi:type II secretory pathway pseudopilin PulG
MIIKTKHKGFSLIEMIIAIIIFMIIISVATIILAKEFQIFASGQNLANADWQGKIALDRMTRDIRSAATITTSGTKIFSFTDIDNNSITYKLDATNNQLTYTINSSSVALADKVDSLNSSFNYYNQDGQQLTNPLPTDKIRYITIGLTIANQSANFNLTTAVFLWNIKN